MQLLASHGSMCERYLTQRHAAWTDTYEDNGVTSTYCILTVFKASATGTIGGTYTPHKAYPILWDLLLLTTCFSAIPGDSTTVSDTVV